MITREELKRLLTYDSSTGIFTNLVKRGRNGMSPCGSISGSIFTGATGKKYVHIVINKKIYKAHRLAWLYFYGSFPENEIDHIDGNGLNNKINNLRHVTRTDNCKNLRRSKNNTSGITGIGRHKMSGKWRVRIGVNNKLLEIGYFDSLFDAACVRKSAEIEYGFHPNHGSNKEIKIYNLRGNCLSKVPL